MEWISVKDELPCWDDVVIATDGNIAEPCRYRRSFYSIQEISLIDNSYIKYWMSLPEPPNC